MADDGVLQRDAVAAKDGTAFAGDRERLARIVELAEAHLLGRDRVRILEAAEVDGQQHALAQFERHVGELLLGHLIAGDRLVELLAVDGVAQGRLEAVASRAERAVGDAEARLIEARERTLEAAHAGQHRRGGQADAVEDEFRRDRRAQRHLLVDLASREAGGVRGDHEAPDAVIGLGPHDGHVSDGAIGDPHLGAVEHPVVAIPLRRGAHPRGIRAEVGLGEAEATDRLALRHARQPLVLLLVRAECVDRVHRQGALHAHERANAGIAGLELHGGKPVGDRVGAGAAVPFEVHAQDAELAELASELACGDRARLEPVGDLRLDAALDEVAHDIADRALLLGEQAVDGEELEWLAGRAAHGSSDDRAGLSR